MTETTADNVGLHCATHGNHEVSYKDRKTY